MNNLIDIIVKYNNLTKEEKELFNKVIKTSSIEEKQNSILKELNDYVDKHKDTIREIPKNPYKDIHNPWILNPLRPPFRYGAVFLNKTTNLGDNYV